jgi:hypothetical protein
MQNVISANQATVGSLLAGAKMARASSLAHENRF